MGRRGSLFMLMGSMSGDGWRMKVEWNVSMGKCMR
jgi:hypothetical protein